MKYRLVELLACPRCHAELEVAGAEHRVSAGSSSQTFRCQRYCTLERRSTIPGPETCAECGRTEIVSGTLACLGCGQKFKIVNAVPWLFDEVAQGSDCRLSDTASLYSHLWSREADSPASAHINGVEASLGEPIVKGRIGLDAGSGSGTDTAVMATRYPSVEVISLDISEGVYATRRRTEHLPNVHVVRGSVLAIPIQAETCDFGYSFGVLHHTADPKRGLTEITRVLKPGGRVVLYLYDDHAGNPWKAIPLKAVTILRRFTVRLNPRILSVFCYILSPFIVLAFSVPAHLMRRFRRTRALAEQIPFNFGTGPFSVHGDLLDRFGAPVELRYSREGLLDLLRGCRLRDLTVTKMATVAGWVARATKDDQIAVGAHT